MSTRTLPPGSSLNYRDAGVDINAGDQLVERIKPIATRTRRPGVINGIGGFGALFELPWDRFRQPVLVSGTDGVGTKLKLAIELKKHDTVGIDLVAMCVNDVVVQGAEPLFFLDYYATGRLDVAAAAEVVAGIGRGCEMAGAALVGGETAEMPGMYQDDDYDLAGFCVGIVEKSRIIDGSNVQAGDALLGFASSGPHSNGYSLIRKVLAARGVDLQQDFHGHSLGEVLLSPTRIYVRSLLALMAALPVRALAHITGGGIVGNLPRVLPDNTCAAISASAWRRPPIFGWLQEMGNIEEMEMYRTFNCGIGMIACLAEEHADAAVNLLHAHGETVWPLGRIIDRKGHAEQVIFTA